MTRLLLAAIMALAAPAYADTGLVLSGTVTRIRDADTITVTQLPGERPIPVRLAGISAPELREPGGRDAKAWLEHLLLGRHVTCSLTGETSHDRLVGYCVTYTDVGDALLTANLVRRCPAFDPVGRYPAGNETLPLPPYCVVPVPKPKP